MSMPTVLLVNDFQDHVGQYTAAFRARGYRIEAVGRAAAVLATARQLRPDCIVIDERIVDRSGWDLCAELKRDRVVGRVPVVMLAPDISSRSVTSGRSSGCNAWLARPTVADDLVRAVEHVLAQKRSTPPSAEESFIGVLACAACHSPNIRAGVGVGQVQYYCCRDCSLCWRVDVGGEATA